MSSSSFRNSRALIPIILLVLTRCSSAPHFDGRRAYQYLLRQTAMGPRNPGSKGHSDCRAFLVKEFSHLADTIIVQDFGVEGVPGTMSNIIARFKPEAEKRIVLCSHWDTRPWADLDPDPKNRSTPIIGANDGASGVAVLLELAGILSSNPPGKGIDIVLFDGEDSGEAGRPHSFCLGSGYYVNHMVAPRPLYGVLVDMVGDSDLDIYVEQYSMALAPQVVGLILESARGSSSFYSSVRHSIHDDHLNLIESGIPCAAIIDFDYEYWHTLEDTPDKCSARSLKTVGDVLLRMVYR